MNPKVFFGLMFGVPTVFLMYIYYEIGINNLWQLFLFSLAAAIGYMPGIILYTYYIRGRIQKTLLDFVDYRSRTE